MKNLNPLLIAALIAALGVLLFTLPGHAAKAVILVCELNTVCTTETARIFFTVPVESESPEACLKTGMRKVAKVADLVDKTEFVRVNCSR